MEKYKLVCKKENEEILRELFQAHHIILDEEASVTLCEQGIINNDNNDVIIHFQMDKISALLRIIKEDKQRLSMLMGKLEENYIPLEINQIVFIRAYGNDTYAYTFDGKSCKIKNKLYELEDEILSKRYIRINKSEIVNISYIIRITPMFKGNLILKMQNYKEQLDVSRNYIKNFKERIGM